MSDRTSDTKDKIKTVDFSIDGEPFETATRDVTPRQLLEGFARLDASTHYLIWVHGRSQESYEGRADETIRIHEHQTFITAATGPTPVS